jgi:anti-sigma regulatory factor (Ser/Thr protein kinase)/anti-anti-sigma regulatory factor
MQTCDKHMNAIPFPADLSKESIDKFLSFLENQSGPETTMISIDCSKLSAVSSSHIGILWLAWENCQKNDIKIRLLYPAPALIRVLQILNMTEFFMLERDPEAVDKNKTRFIQTDIIHQKYDDIFNATIDDINKALKRYENFLLQIRLPRDVAFDLKTVFYEVAYNIYDHGTLGPRDEIAFTADLYNNRIVMEFSDRGLPFDPTSQEINHHLEDAINNRRIRGFGLMMINKLIDSISYVYRDNCKNILKLEKTWRHRNE